MFLIKLVVVAISVCLSVSAFAVNDPTRPPFMMQQAPKHSYDPLRLSMILQEGYKRRAIINESIVGVSDSVAGAKVIKINEDNVVVRRAGRQIKLTLSLQGIREPSLQNDRDTGNE